MGSPQGKVELELVPQSRFDIIDVSGRISEKVGDGLVRFRKILYYSYHTTAGYLEQSLCERLNNDSESVRAFVESFQKLFPPQADYYHDNLNLRDELTDEQKLDEPLNADSHLTYIGSGLANCVTYRNHPGEPVYFIDLDGMYRNVQRRRWTTAVGFNQEQTARRLLLEVPVSDHAIDSVSLKDDRLGFFEEIGEIIRRHEIVNGRVDISLVPEERHAGLTVNEYETLLMRHDLAEVLRNPVRFMAEKGKHMLADPKAIPGKALNYAKYDLVHVVNEFIDALGLNESLLERIIDKFLAVPAERFLRMKRSVSLLVSSDDPGQIGRIVEGDYQSPVLVQWRKAESRSRRLSVSLVRLD